MIIKKRFEKIPETIIESQKSNQLTSDLYLCEVSELLISKNTHWKNQSFQNHFLLYCTNGDCHLQISNENVVLKQEQFCIIPEYLKFSIEIGKTDPTSFLTCKFNGSKCKIIEREFSVVRDLVPSINNNVANRKMIFDEIFKNLMKGYSNANMLYVNSTFSHLLATFIFASKTSDDIMEEEDPFIQKAKKFLEINVDKKITLKNVADEVGISPTYLSTIFKRNTNYSPISYFSHLKILKACEYLDQTKHKIKQIAFMLGYSDPYYFSKDFHKKMGISPRNYRKRLLQ